MTHAQRIEQEKQRLQERLDALRKQVASVQVQRDLETRAEEQVRQDEWLVPRCAEIKKIEGSLKELEKELRVEETEGLVREARERERRQAHDQAIARWREIADLGMERWDAAKEIERLEALKAQAVKRSFLVREMGKRQAELGDAYLKLVSVLRKPEDPLLLDVQPLIEDFVRRELGGRELAAALTALRSGATASVGAVPFDFAASLRRLQRGEIALFLGADLPNYFDSQLPTSQRLAEALAAEVRLPAPLDSLSAVAEYYAIMHGPASLVRSLYERLPVAAANPLYALLARAQEPLLIIAAGHDSLLEDSFRRSGRRFATISLVVSPMADFRPGQIILRYSDQDQPKEPCLADDLSKHPLLEDGYSVIFKIRGAALSPQRPDARDLCSLVLWERRHFDFARNVDKLLPSYLSRQLATRGFWFLGFSPARWEERFLASVILENRRSPEPAVVVHREVKDLEAAYWQSCHAVRHAFDLPEFVAYLEAAR